MSEPHLDEDLAWAPDWPCPACTLLNASEAVKCVACDTFRPGSGNSQVVVVLPREAPKRPADDSWACPACTLLNGADSDNCAACGGERWLKRQMTAAALRARTKASKAQRSVESDGCDSSLWSDHGIWGGLGPDREFLPLPPAPEGRVIYRSATDGELDMFNEADSEKPPVEAAEADGKDQENPEVPSLQPVETAEVPVEGAKVEVSDIRPAWRIEGTPLFGDVELGDALEDAVARLAAGGFDHTKCLVALEAAGGDEDLARTFLWQMKKNGGCFFVAG